ncbi:retrotransposon protein, putative, ty1-copia subclass [Tanacetum coccineum]
MDAAVHTFKARLVAKGFTQTYGVDYKETLSPVADIRAIRILIAITAYYDYEIWQMDCKNSPQWTSLRRGETTYILGIKICKDRSRWLIGLCQSAYIEKILKRFHMENSKRGSIPMQEKLRLSKSQGASTPAELKRIKSTKQSIFATSSAEAEYIAAYDASKEAVWVRKFISGLGVVPTIEEPINMYCDNTGAITIANESGITKGARHFRAKVHYLREVIEYGDIKLEKVHTYDNLADPFTKALAFPKHSEHTRNIGMLPASSLM